MSRRDSVCAVGHVCGRQRIALELDSSQQLVWGVDTYGMCTFVPISSTLQSSSMPHCNISMRFAEPPGLKLLGLLATRSSYDWQQMSPWPAEADHRLIVFSTPGGLFKGKASAACEAMHRGLERYQAHMELELAAEELRAAAKALGHVTGTINTEDLLDAIFSKFCIGK